MNNYNEILEQNEQVGQLLEQQVMEQYPIIDCPPYYYPYWDTYSLLSEAILHDDIALVTGILNSTMLNVGYDLTNLTQFYAPQGSVVEDYLLHNGANANILALEALFNKNISLLQHYFDKGADAQFISDIAHNSFADGYGRVHVYMPESLSADYYFTGMYENPYAPNEYWVKVEGLANDYDTAWTTFLNMVDEATHDYLPTSQEHVFASVDLVEDTLVLPAAELMVSEVAVVV